MPDHSLRVSSGSRRTDSRVAGEYLHEFVDHAVVLRLIAFLKGVPNARVDVVREEDLADLAQGSLDGRQLEQDIYTVLVVCDHPVEPAHLTLDAAES